MADRSTAASSRRTRRLAGSRSPGVSLTDSQRDPLVHKEMVRLARMVQESLLPPSHAEFSGLELAARFLPAANVAGDFFDYFPLGPGRLAVYLGDVQGKGLEAAMNGLVVSGIMRGIHKSGTSPAEVLSLVNRRLCYNSFPGKFSCLGYALFDLPQHRITFASAGVPFSLLLRDAKLTPIELTGTPVGLFEAGQFDQTEISLRRGDRLLFYTDGLPDSLHFLHPDRGEGAAQLRELLTQNSELTASELADKLLAPLQSPGQSDGPAKDQTEGQQLPDDATFLVLHFGGPMLYSQL